MTDIKIKQEPKGPVSPRVKCEFRDDAAPTDAKSQAPPSLAIQRDLHLIAELAKYLHSILREEPHVNYDDVESLILFGIVNGILTTERTILFVSIDRLIITALQIMHEFPLVLPALTTSWREAVKDSKQPLTLFIEEQRKLLPKPKTIQREQLNVEFHRNLFYVAAPCLWFVYKTFALGSCTVREIDQQIQWAFIKDPKPRHLIREEWVVFRLFEHRKLFKTILMAKIVHIVAAAGLYGGKNSDANRRQTAFKWALEMVSRYASVIK